MKTRPPDSQDADAMSVDFDGRSIVFLEGDDMTPRKTWVTLTALVTEERDSPIFTLETAFLSPFLANVMIDENGWVVYRLFWSLCGFLRVFFLVSLLVI
jgi:hypothetical protein